jgi:hypothetical protein
MPSNATPADGPAALPQGRDAAGHREWVIQVAYIATKVTHLAQPPAPGPPGSPRTSGAAGAHGESYGPRAPVVAHPLHR